MTIVVVVVEQDTSKKPNGFHIAIQYSDNIRLVVWQAPCSDRISAIGSGEVGSSVRQSRDFLSIAYVISCTRLLMQTG